MKLRNIILATASAGLLGLFAVSCDNQGEDVSKPECTFSESTLEFGSAADVQTVKLLATRDWVITCDSSFVGISPLKGTASSNEVEIEITVTKNTGYSRSAVVKANAGNGLAKATLTIEQAGEKGEYVVPTVTIAEFIESDGETEYVVSGKITSVNTTYKYVYINDGTGEIEVYQPTNWSDFESQLAVGATLTAQGKYTLYTNSSGKTYDELVGKILSVVPKQAQENVEEVTCAVFITTDGTTEYIISGEITSVSTDYKYAYISDGTAEVEVYQPTNWSDFADKIKVGATMKAQGVYSKYTNASGKTFDELVGVILSIEEAAAVEEEATGSGTLEDPYNPKAAYDVAAALESGAKTSTDVYVKGVISKVTYTFSAAYGTATFNISEAGATTGTQLPCYSIYYLGNTAWTEGDAQIAVGDEVVICGKLTNYSGNTPETASKEAYVYSLNGETSIAQSAVFGVAKKAISVAASATSATVSVTGNVAWTASSEDATIDVTSGEGKGDITVTFDANTDEENTKTYTVTVSTTADVDVQSYNVVITQGKAGSTQVEFVIADIASENSWANGTQYSSITKEGVTLTASGGGNTGKFYTNGNEWRFYQTESASLTISVSDGQTFVSASFEYNIANTGVLLDSDGAQVASGDESSSLTYSVGNTGSASNGQVKFTKIVVSVE